MQSRQRRSLPAKTLAGTAIHQPGKCHVFKANPYPLVHHDVGRLPLIAAAAIHHLTQFQHLVPVEHARLA